MGRIGPKSLARAAVLATGIVCAQQQPVIRVDVRLVRLLVTVKDAESQLVGSLDKGLFQVFDSGVKQEIAVFERHTAQPLSIALLVDISASTAKDLKYEIESSARFLKTLTREGNPEDKLALFTFNHEVTRQVGFTRDSGRVEKTLHHLKAEAGTSLYDAILLGSQDLEDRGGRKVILVVTDGGDTTSRSSYQSALKAAHRADASIYSIVVVPITNDAGRNTGGENALITLARSTGGRAFFPAVGPALDHAFADILRDLRTQYLLGYYPRSLPPSKDRWRSVSVQINRPDLRASTRGGYYGE